MDKEIKDGQPLVSPPTIQKMDRGGDNDEGGETQRTRGGTVDEGDEKDAWWAKDKV